jgi:hypothetical protein
VWSDSPIVVRNRVIPDCDSRDCPHSPPLTLAEIFLSLADNNLKQGANNFADQLRAELERRSDRETLRVIARYMTIAVLGEAGCQVALGKGGEAAKAIDGRLPTLQAYGRLVFEQTAGRDPTRFLIPAMAEQAVILDTLAELFRQADPAGVVQKSIGRGASDLFEAIRDDLFRVKDPWFRRTRAVRRMDAELAEARRAVEDVNWVANLALAIRESDQPGRPFRELTQLIDREISARAGSADTPCYIYLP